MPSETWLIAMKIRELADLVQLPVTLLSSGYILSFLLAHTQETKT